MMKEKFVTPWRLVIVAAIGYFVDLFDTFLLPAVRIPSLAELGVPDDLSLATYTVIFNWQLAGMAVGALFLWGPFADGRGRRKILFGSIIVYSIANLLTAAVQDVTQYEIVRFIAGVGLGGELGAGVTLVAEQMNKGKRGIGTMIIGAVGMLGVVFASLLALTGVYWRYAYIIGGVLGILILLLRVGVDESELFLKRKTKVNFGLDANNQILQKDEIDVSTIANRKPAYFKILAYIFSIKRKKASESTTVASEKTIFSFDTLTERPLVRFLLCILVGTPTFFFTGLLVPGAPEFGKAFGMTELPSPALALIYTYVSISIGDIFCGFLSQALSSRKKALLIFHGITVIGTFLFLFLPPTTPTGFYIRCVIAGTGIGYWANMVTNAAEQFGTDVRATITITVPNLVRFLLFPISGAFWALKPSVGVITAAAIVGLISSAVAIFAVCVLRDNFSRDLDYVEIV
jgi:hypothetical protein